MCCHCYVVHRSYVHSRSHDIGQSSEALGYYIHLSMLHLPLLTLRIFDTIRFNQWVQGAGLGLISAVTHLIPNTYGPQTYGSPHLVPNWLVPLNKQSPTNSVPMDKWSPKIWSLWTNGPQPIWSPYFRIPTACPLGQTEYSRDHLSRGTELVGDHLSMGTKFLGTICPWGLN